MRTKKESKSTVGVRVLNSLIPKIDELAEAEGQTRAAWLEHQILKALGKRPRRTLAQRVAKLEATLKELREEVAPVREEVDGSDRTGNGGGI